MAVSHVEEETLGMNVAIVCIYCDYKDPKTRSEFQILASITRQLVEQCIPMPSEVRAFRDKYTQKRTGPGEEEHLSLIRTLSQLFEKTYVFVDALVSCIPYYGNLTSC